MITRGQRREGQPILIQSGSPVKLDRVPFIEKSFREHWIQELIHSQPSILPIDEIDSGFAPLIPIGREISTPVGSIDNLFVSPEGYLTIVETKLWRNPEARREVVGQILDYAKELNKWTFTDLNNAVIAYNGNKEGIVESIKKFEHFDETEVQYLIDNISKNLNRGRFLLLIVGDGIRESVEDMVEYLNQTPQLFFTLALIELQVFKVPKEKDSFLVIPQVVTRTKEITRAIFRVEGAQSQNLKITIDADLEGEDAKKSRNPHKRFTITADDFFEQLERSTDKKTVQATKGIIAECEEKGYYIHWGQGSVVVKLSDPEGSGIKITLFVIDKRGTVVLGWSAGQIDRLGIPKEISYKFSADTAKLFSNIKPSPKYPEGWVRAAQLTDMIKVSDKFIACVDSFVSDISEALEKQNV
ncbi:MAG TPA: hypothetical protein PLE74_07820 [Candidatus Cloacimonadota bacterium]|nr:hypothetical protein [Candidatus Cloacimonadota bacterium]